MPDHLTALEQRAVVSALGREIQRLRLAQESCLRWWQGTPAKRDAHIAEVQTEVEMLEAARVKISSGCGRKLRNGG